MRNLICLILCGTIFMSGCASVMCSPEKTININSSPPATSFEIKDANGNTVVKSITPTNVTLKRGRGWFKAADYKISFDRAGCKPATIPIQQGLEVGWYIGGNVLIGGLIGWLIVDPLTGAMWNIKDVNISLDCTE